MIRFFAAWFAKVKYIWNEESQSALHIINADASAYRATERRKQADMLNGQAEAIEARIRELDEKQEKGYWICENGHEEDFIADATYRECHICNKPMKLISLATMTGQEKYESEKERKDAEGMADGLRAEAQQQEETIKTHQEHEKAFRQQAQRTREFAELLRKL